MAYFRADADDFDVVFTANASAAVKLIADCFRGIGFDYVYHKDVHTSVVGVRQLANSSQCLATNEEVEHWIELQKYRTTSNLQLFAYPAQSNLNGHRPPYTWCKSIRSVHQPFSRPQTTYVLLDAASYLTSGRLDLACANDAPDFIALSFYKIFGFPDLGALLVKKSASDVLTRRGYFGGGTVDTVTVFGSAFHAIKRQDIHDFLEDGTLPFHNIVALEHAITIHKTLFGSAEVISNHLAHLIARLHNDLTAMKHFTGAPVVDIYQDHKSTYGDPLSQGPIVAFNILHSNGAYIGKSHIERLAIACGFQIRTGGVCNPGGIASMLHLTHWELMRNFTEGVRCGGEIDIVGAKPTGICRVSLGPMSTMSDVSRFVKFIKHFFVEKKARDISTCLGAASTIASTRTITPINNCPGYSVPPQFYDAHSSFNKKWCIVASDTGVVVESGRLLENLTVEVDVTSELLRITHASGDDTSLSLWELPKSSGDFKKPFDQHSIHLYEHPINNWISTHIGLTCVLGFYPQEHFSQKEEASTCVIHDCALGCVSKQSLHEHYLAHAETFMDVHPFARIADLLCKQSVEDPRDPEQEAKSDSPLVPISTSIVPCSAVAEPPSFALTDAVRVEDRTSESDTITNVVLSEKPLSRVPKSRSHLFSMIMTRLTGRG